MDSVRDWDVSSQRSFAGAQDIRVALGRWHAFLAPLGTHQPSA